MKCLKSVNRLQYKYMFKVNVYVWVNPNLDRNNAGIY